MIDVDATPDDSEFRRHHDETWDADRSQLVVERLRTGSDLSQTFGWAVATGETLQLGDDGYWIVCRREERVADPVASRLRLPDQRLSPC